MTWERYLRAPTGRHVCPACQRKSRFTVTIASMLRTFAMVCIGAIPFGLIFWFFVSHQAAVAGGTLGGLLTGIPLDKFYEGHFRKLEKCEDENTPPSDSPPT
jgi:hypothetical protein